MNNFKNEILDKYFNNKNITDISFNGKDIYVQDNEIGRYKISDEVDINEVENYIKQITYQNNQQSNGFIVTIYTQFGSVQARYNYNAFIE